MLCFSFFVAAHSLSQELKMSIVFDVLGYIDQFFTDEDLMWWVIVIMGFIFFKTQFSHALDFDFGGRLQRLLKSHERYENPSCVLINFRPRPQYISYQLPKTWWVPILQDLCLAYKSDLSSQHFFLFTKPRILKTGKSHFFAHFSPTALRLFLQRGHALALCVPEKKGTDPPAE